ncbi:MAG: hypothetical protein P4L10_14105 [Acidobacteriaceae bacterium]|nr:hypothetical protein [Acidobacteriaceae bacterium]
MPIENKATTVQISERVLQWLRYALIAVSVVMVAAFLAAAKKRLHYAFEYDWIEDGMLASVRHICAGQPLYSAPSVHFTPYLYTPVYLYLAAALSKLIGISYVPLRLISILATLGCFAGIYALVFSETRRVFAGAAAVGFFAACYPVLEGSFDIGRVDMLFICVVLWAIFATRRMHPLFAALLWVCAFQTKQGVLPIAMLFLCHEWQRPRRVAMGVGGFAAMMALSIGWLTHATGGWYRYYVFGMAGGFGFEIHQAAHFIPYDLLAVCGIALLLVLAAFLVEPPPMRSAAFSFYLLGTVGMVVFTGYLRAHRGANVNSLIPAYAWIGILFGVALARLYRLLEANSARAAMAVLLVAAMTQMAQHYYSPAEYVVAPEEAALRNQFEATLRKIPGDVLVLSHPEDGMMAGKAEYAGSESIGAVIEAKQQKNGDQLMQDYAALIHSRRLSAVVLDAPAEYFLGFPRVWMPGDFLAYYPLRVQDAGGDSKRFTSQPKYIYLPCPSAGATDVARLLDAHVDESVCTAR